MSDSPYVLSIAGFDPCGAAGIMADCKTFEQHKVFGLGVVSAVTSQHESNFVSVQWLSLADMAQQLKVLSLKYQPAFIKILCFIKNIC